MRMKRTKEFNTKTEEATSMGAHTEVIGESGPQKHVKRFHEKGATAACTEDSLMFLIRDMGPCYILSALFTVSIAFGNLFQMRWSARKSGPSYHDKYPCVVDMLPFIKIMRIRSTKGECLFFPNVTTNNNFCTVHGVHWYVTWVSAIPNSIINGMCSQQFFYRSCWPKLVFGNFRDVNIDARSNARCGEIFRCCNFSNVCTFSAYGIVVCVFKFRIITLLFVLIPPLYLDDDLWFYRDIMSTDILPLFGLWLDKLICFLVDMKEIDLSWCYCL